MNSEQASAAGVTRRDFIRTATGAAVAGSVASGFDRLTGAYAAGSDEIRIGLVGCGGRGTGAAGNALKSAQGVRLVAIADAFQDRLDSARKAQQKASDQQQKSFANTGRSRAWRKWAA